MEDKQKAFEALFEEELAYVCTTIRRLGARGEQIQDLAQEVFLTVFKILDDFDTSRPVRPWLFGISYRVFLRNYHLARNRRELLLEPPAQADPGRGPEAQASAEQERALVAQALGSLETDRRSVFIMKELDDIAVPEIAETLGIPLNTAYSRLRLARRDFKAAVTEIVGETP